VRRKIKALLAVGFAGLAAWVVSAPDRLTPAAWSAPAGDAARGERVFNIGPARFDDAAKHVTADAAKAVDGYFYSHVRVPSMR
jgi:hypothetical protein